MLAVGYGVLWALKPGHNITRDNAARLEARMTVTQVVDLLGVPAGNYSTGPIDGRAAPVPLDTKVWESDEVKIVVSFNRHGKIYDVIIYWKTTDRSLFDRLRLWLGL